MIMISESERIPALDIFSYDTMSYCTYSLEVNYNAVSFASVNIAKMLALSPVVFEHIGMF